MTRFIDPFINAYSYEDRTKLIGLFLQDMRDDNSVFSNPNVLEPSLYFLEKEYHAAYFLASKSPSIERERELAELRRGIDEQKERLAKLLGFLFL